MHCLVSSSRPPGTVSTWQGSRPWDWYNLAVGGPPARTPSGQSNTWPECTDRTPSGSPGSEKTKYKFLHLTVQKTTAVTMNQCINES